MIRLARERAEEGFTLIELLIVITIMPLIVGAISLGLMTTFENRDTTVSRVSDSHDAQITAAYFARDVKSAQYVSTAPTPLCGTANQILGLSWTTPGGTAVTHNVSYAMSPTSFNIVRSACAGSSGSPSIRTVAHDAFPAPPEVAGAPAPTVGGCPSAGFGSGATTCGLSGGNAYTAITVSCSDTTTTCTDSGSLATTPLPKSSKPGVSSVRIDVLENQSKFDYHVTASPEGWSTTAAGQPPGGLANPPALDLLGPNGSGSFQGSGSCSLTVNGVAVINNPSDGSVSLGHNGGFTATGGIYAQSPDPVSGGSGNPPTTTVGPPLGDPYADLNPPPSPGDAPVTVNNSGSLSGQLDGIYILNKGLAGSNITSKPKSAGGHGVLLYVPPSSPNGIDLTGTGNIALSDVYPGYDGISIWVANNDGISLGGNGNTTAIGGTVYAPNGSVSLSGGGNGGGVNAGAIAAKSLSCQGGGNGVGFTTGPQNTTTKLVANPSPSGDGAPITLSATVTYVDANNITQPVSAGTVKFEVTGSDGGQTADCAAPASVNGSGTATCVTGNLSAAESKYSITATYQGTGSFGPSSDSAMQSVLRPTTTVLNTTASDLVSGQSATFMATVSSPSGPTPTGTVTFSGVNCTGSNTVTLSAGGATCTTAKLLAGSSPYTVNATYNDPGSPQTWLTSTDQKALSVAVASTTTALVSSKPTSRPAATVVFTATVTPNAPSGATSPDGGNVTFTVKGQNGNTVACSGSGGNTKALSGSTAACTVGDQTGNELTVAAAPYTVTATYLGDASYSSSTTSITQNVAKAGTQTTFLSLSTNGNSHKWTDSVTVSATGGDTGTPTGHVFFYLCANTTSGCTATTPKATMTDKVVDGSGTASTGTLSLDGGTKYCFGVVYQGDNDYASSTEPLDLGQQCFTG